MPDAVAATVVHRRCRSRGIDQGSPVAISPASRMPQARAPRQGRPINTSAAHHFPDAPISIHGEPVQLHMGKAGSLFLVVTGTASYAPGSRAIETRRRRRGRARARLRGRPRNRGRRMNGGGHELPNIAPSEPEAAEIATVVVTIPKRKETAAKAPSRASHEVGDARRSGFGGSRAAAGAQARRLLRRRAQRWLDARNAQGDESLHESGQCGDAGRAAGFHTAGPGSGARRQGLRRFLSGRTGSGRRRPLPPHRYPRARGQERGCARCHLVGGRPLDRLRGNKLVHPNGRAASCPSRGWECS